MSAEALLPIAAVLSSHGGPAVQDIQKALWETLDEVDDLSSCAGMASGGAVTFMASFGMSDVTSPSQR